MLSQSYRRPRRPPASLRTKSGCLTCRKRRKKCDETPTICRNCAKQNTKCLWPGRIARSVSNRDAEFSSTDRAKQRKPQGSTAPDDRSETETDKAIEMTTKEKSRRSEFGDDPSRWMQPVFLNTSGALGVGGGYLIGMEYSAFTRGSGMLFEFLKAIFLPQLIRPTATCRVIQLFSGESLAMATQEPACMHALLACSGAEIPTQTSSIQSLARYHYTKAVAALRDSLAQGEMTHRWLVIMHTVLMLCIYERSKPRGPANAEIHLAGAAQLIHLASQKWQTRPGASESECMMHRLVHESFIFHVATSLPFQPNGETTANIKSAFALSENHLSQYFHIPRLSYPESPVLGVSPQLFRYSFAVYSLYRRFSPNQSNLKFRDKLETELAWWDRWTQAALPDSPRRLPMNQADCSHMAHASWHQMAEKDRTAVLGPRLYFIGCRILLQRMLYHDQCRPDEVIDALLSEGMGAIRRLQPAMDYFAEYYCWPFYVIGIHLVEPSDRDCLLAQALAFSVATNNGTMKRLSDVLLKHWDLSEAA